jgi:hypothetical protein
MVKTDLRYLKEYLQMYVFIFDTSDIDGSVSLSRWAIFDGELM